MLEPNAKGGSPRPAVRFNRLAARAVAIYVAVAAVYIVVSDWVVHHWAAGGEQELQTAKGIGFVLVTATVLFVHLSRELRRRETTERVRRRSERMNALGNLAAGIAHDFNNLLMPIKTLTRMVLSREHGDEENRQCLERVLSAAVRAEDLVRRIHAFTHDAEDIAMEVIDLSKVVSDSVALFRPTLPGAINLDAECPAQPCLILGNVAHLESVILNLARNAADAIGHDRGTIRIRVSPVHVRTAFLTATGRLPAGPYINVAVADTGPGMDPETAEHVFEPFFTTKKAGEGTGLGLANVHAVVARHGGGINVRTAPGKGTSVEVLLPTATAADR